MDQFLCMFLYHPYPTIIPTVSSWLRIQWELGYPSHIEGRRLLEFALAWEPQEAPRHEAILKQKKSDQKQPTTAKHWQSQNEDWNDYEQMAGS